MTTCLKTARSLQAVGAAIVLLFMSAGIAIAQSPPSDADAQPQPPTAKPQAPDADTVKVYDRPSDDGSAIIIEWARPADQPGDQQDTQPEQVEPADDSPEQADLSPEDLARVYLLITELIQDDVVTGAEVQRALATLAEIDAARQGPPEPQVYYVVEVARSREDMANDVYKTVNVLPSEDTLKSASSQYFGFSSENEDYYYAQIIPAELFQPDPPRLFPAELAKLAELAELADDPDEPDLALDALTAVRLRQLAWLGVLTNDEADRVIATFDIDEPVIASDIDDLDSQVLEELYVLLTDAVVDGEIDEDDVNLLIRASLAEVHDLAEKRSPQEDAELAWLAGLKLYLRMVQLYAEGVVTESETQRARDALAIVDAVAKDEAQLTVELNARQQAQPADDNAGDVADKGPSPREQAEQALSRAQRDELVWFGRLAEWVAKHDQKAQERAVRKTNEDTYYFCLAVVDTDGEKSYVSDRDGAVVFSGRAKVNPFKRFKLNSLIFAVVFCGIVLAFIQIAKRKPDLFIRKIAGLEAVEEAIGRATEMGKSVYFVHGLGGMGGMATIAAINVLGRVARRAAEYDTRVQVMNIDPIVTAVSQEVVQQAYTEAGRPDAFDPDDVALVAAGQFSYAAAVAGRMAREQPAAIFLMGSFMAESLLLSESGAATGAIQVAGTDAYHQLPFFVTTCDYTLIGEELYAASAYLSREPRLLGSIRGQDVGKAFMMLAILIGVVALTIAVALGKDLSWIRDIFRVF